GRPAVRSLPDMGAKRGWAPHGGAGRNFKGVVELLHIHVGADGAKLARAVGVNGDESAGFGLAAVYPPNLGEGQEEALFGSESADRFAFGRIFREGALKGFEGNASPAKIGDVLAQGEFSVHVQTGQNFVSVVLLDDLEGAGLKSLGIGR